MKKKTPKAPPAKKTGKTEKKEFPGYPLYPPSDDITDRAKQVPADLEDPSLQENSSAGNVPGETNKTNYEKQKHHLFHCGPWAARRRLDSFDVAGRQGLSGHQRFRDCRRVTRRCLGNVWVTE